MAKNTTAESSFETSLSSNEWKADWMRTPRAYVQRKKGFGTQPPGHAVSSRVYS